MESPRREDTPEPEGVFPGPWGEGVGSTLQLREELREKLARVYWNLYWRTLKNGEWIIPNVEWLMDWIRTTSDEKFDKVREDIARLEKLSEETARTISEIQRTALELVYRIKYGEADE